MRGRTGRTAALLASAGVMLSGCGLGNGLYDAPLPGGADLGGHPYSLKIRFTNALDLVPQSGVRVDDVPVGRVDSIRLVTTGPDAGRVAVVSVTVRGDVDLPRNAVAAIRQTTLLGEKYVGLAPPAGTAPTGRLRDGDTVALSQTSQAADVEVVFGALSELLNGGGIGRIKEITGQLGTVLHNSGSVRQFLDSTRRVVTQIGGSREPIVRALTSLDTLTVALRKQTGTIARVLTSLAPGIAILRNQRAQFVGMLRELDRLSLATNRTLDASKNAIVGDLRALAPVLRNLAKTGSNLPKSLQVLFTFPFPDGALNAIAGDYFNAYARTDYRTKCAGKCVVATQQKWPAASPQRRGKVPVITPPPSLLPNTSSAAPGLPSTLPVAPKTSGSAGTSTRSTPGSGSGSTSTSRSGSGSRSDSPSRSQSGSRPAPGSPSGSGDGN